MPQSIEVGSVLGGRYKVVGHVLDSADDDVILEGIDQVLKRRVSILVAAPANSANLTQSAREVATGERNAHVSILDLGTADQRTYLIASRTAPAELLDLVVPTEPMDTEGTDDADDGPYVEPFFTDTLGTEIFGTPRDNAAAESAYVYDDDAPAEHGPRGKAQDEHAPTPHPAPPRPPTPPAASVPVPRSGTNAVEPSPTEATPVAPAPPGPAGTASVAETAPKETAPKPKVTVWSEADFADDGLAGNEPAEDGRSKGGIEGTAAAFPASGRTVIDNGTGGEPVADGHGDVDDDEANAPRTGLRWLTGGIVTILVAAALVFALTNISSLWSGGNQAAAPTAAASPPQAATKGSSPTTASPSTPAVVPQIKAITRYTPGNPTVSAQFDGRLGDAFDDNLGTYWPTLEFSNDTFAGMTDSINLVVELAQPAVVNSVTIHQIAGSGGQFNILTNDTATLDGATRVGSGSFSAPDITVKTTSATPSRFVIINFTQLPKLQPFVTYPYGLKIAEINLK